MTLATPSHLRAPLLVLAAIAVAPAASGCKPAATKAGQAPMVVDDDIEAIERQLAVNADNLRSEGIVIARAEVPAEPTTTVGVGAETSDDAGLDGDLADQTQTEPAQPEPVLEQEEMAPPPSEAPASKSAYRSSGVRERRADRRYARERNKRERTRCERICDLADATCDLAEQICDLADRHVDEVRYEDACERAAEQCRVASTACTKCEDD